MKLDQFTPPVETSTATERPHIPAHALPRHPESGLPMLPGEARTGNDAIASTIQRHGEALTLLSK